MYIEKRPPPQVDMPIRPPPRTVEFRFLCCGVQAQRLWCSAKLPVAFRSPSLRAGILLGPPSRMASHRTRARTTAGGPFAPIQSPRNRASLK